MRVRWSKLAVKTAIWFCAEVMLTLAGVDDLVDYSEFVFLHRGHASSDTLVTYPMV